MKSVRPLFSIFFAIIWMFLGIGLFLISANVNLANVGITADKIGYINSAFYLGAAISAMAAQKWISKVGHIRCFAMFSAIVSIGILSHQMTQNFVFLILLRFIMGFSYYANLMIIESWINEKSNKISRGVILGVYTMTYYMSFLVISQLIASNFINQFYLTLAGIFAIIAIVPIMLTRIQQPVLPAKMPISIPKINHVVPLAIVGCIVAGITVGGFITMAPVFVTQKGLDNVATSGFIGAAVLAGMLIQFPMSKLSVKFGRRAALMGASLATMIGAFLMLLPNNIPYMFNLAAFIMGSGIFTIYSLSCARANDRMPEYSNVVEIGRSLLFCFCLGSFLSPVILGYAMKFFGFYGFSVIYIFSAAILFVVASSQVTVPKRFRKPYVNMPVSFTAGIETGVYDNLQPENSDQPTFDKDKEAQMKEFNAENQKSDQ